jgi:hypothetical protein
VKAPASRWNDKILAVIECRPTRWFKKFADVYRQDLFQLPACYSPITNLPGETSSESPNDNSFVTSSGL